MSITAVPSTGTNIRYVVRLSRLVGVGLIGLAWGVLASSATSAQEFSIGEEEVYLFLSRHFDTLAACDADQLATQFDPSATLRFIYTGGRTDEFTFPNYLAWFRKGGCRPYQQIHWDRYGTQVTTAGRQATARWKVTWGREHRKDSRASRLVIEGRIELVRRGGGLLITESQTRFRELAPGAEQAFLMQAENGSLFGAALRFYQGAIEMIQDLRRRRQTTQRP